MKKSRLIPLSFITILGVLSLLSLTLVSAAYGYSTFDLKDASEGAIEIVVDFAEPFLQILLGGEDYSGMLLFERFLLFAIILSVVYLSISRLPMFEDNKPVIWIISLAVPLLSIRFISFEWINTIILQYQVLGIALTGILPFIIYFFFLHNISESSAIRKVGWIFYIVVYFGLWSTTEKEIYGEIYFWTMLIALIFLLFDGTIHRWYMRYTMKESGSSGKWDYIIKLKADIQATEQSDLKPRIKDKIIRGKKKQIERWLKWKPV